ncbi:DNA-processing protein DprA [Miniphocaeibacter massiliensis]|uniref:DNA-processing protein DprA n=1 Tax=Miniphocaeibacter massiliensis TaxID=2041841 RepID=UPI000C07C193|nr:DNA-processing protein DprA [Miniphocaeibacter massiliensis]
MSKKLILFLNAVGISNNNMRKLLESFENLKELKQNKDFILDIKNIDKRTLNKIIKNLNFDIDKYIEKIKNSSVKLTFYGDENFPINLYDIEDYPMMLYYKGNLKNEDSKGISIVGARKCTNYGAWACSKISEELSKCKIPIISGMASGIDKISHEISIKNNNRTIAVLGSGLDVIYPQTNHDLYYDIIQNGAVISEFPLGTKPYPYNFPYRNRIISGIGQGVVVIEAMEKSGTLITANYGAEQGKEVFAVPGNINSLYSKGTNLLIRDGAKIVASVEDILEEIEYDTVKENLVSKQLEGISKLIYEEICKNNSSADELSNILNIKIDEINVILTILELNGYIIETNGGKFSPN